MEDIELVIQQRDDSFKRERDLIEWVKVLQDALILREAVIVSVLGDLPDEDPSQSAFVVAVERLKELGYLPDYYELG